MPPLMNVSTPQCYESLARLEAIEAAALLTGHGEPWRSGVGPAVAQARERRGRR
jgi:hypothetical protein